MHSRRGTSAGLRPCIRRSPLWPEFEFSLLSSEATASRGNGDGVSAVGAANFPGRLPAAARSAHGTRSGKVDQHQARVGLSAALPLKDLSVCFFGRAAAASATGAGGSLYSSTTGLGAGCCDCHCSCACSRDGTAIRDSQNVQATVCDFSVSRTSSRSWQTGQVIRSELGCLSEELTAATSGLRETRFSSHNFYLTEIVDTMRIVYLNGSLAPELPSSRGTLPRSDPFVPRCTALPFRT